MKTKLNLISASIATAMALAACGGGGGGSSTGGTTPPVSQTCTNGATDYPTCTPAVTPANLQTSVPAPTYSANSEELVAFNEINAFRKSMGLGLLAQNVNLDKAAANHANYIVLNQIFDHAENSTKQGYTGLDSLARGSFAGYSGSYVGEMLATSSGVNGIRMLMNSVYHRNGVALQDVVDMGISFNSSWVKPLVVEVGFAKKSQNNAGYFTTSYPVDGQTDVPLVMYPESPDPFQELVSDSSGYLTKTSAPVSFYSAKGTTISVSTFSVTENGQSTPLDMRLITQANDINKLVPGHNVHLVGKAPFKPNTKYIANFTGSIDGRSISKSWSFTTGTSLNLGGSAKL